MRDELLDYYERELTYIRHTAKQFAERYPKIASRLDIEADKCEDPHVERIIEAFAFLAARVHLKIDDEFPEITEAILGIVLPHFIRPIPSMSIVQFALDPAKGKLTTGHAIKAGSVLDSRPVEGVRCKFRTCYETTLWPIRIGSCDWRTPDRLNPPLRPGDAVGAIRMTLESPRDLPLSGLEMDKLRFHLTGESGLVHTLYELLCCKLTEIWIRDLAKGSKAEPLRLEPTTLKPVGFEADEGMVPFDRRSFVGYRLLQEYFTFPEKFFFFDLTGLEQLSERAFSNEVEVIFFIARFEGEQRRRQIEMGITDRTFQLGCAPVVNLYPLTADPIRLDQQKFEYRVVPDPRRPLASEIFSIDDVASLRTGPTQEIVRFQPFYSFRHTGEGFQSQALWIANRRPSNRLADEGTEIDLSLVDLAFNPSRPTVDTLTVKTTCTNRDLPAKLPFGQFGGDFELAEGGGPVKSITAITKPTPPIRPAIGKAIQWKLISHLSLNYLSLVQEGKAALQEILKLYSFRDSAHAEKVVAGITNVTSAPHFAPIRSENGIVFARGTKVEIEVDEEQFVGGGAYLFLSVIERFLGLYASLNSFSQLSASSVQRKEGIRRWPPRAGRRILM